MQNTALREKDAFDGDRLERNGNDPLFVVLMADDDEDDYLLVKSAFEAGPVTVDLRWVQDGQEALDYLLHVGKYVARELSPRPDLILLDLIMPQKDGLETLREIKGHPYLQKIPVVMLTTSAKQEHRNSGLRLGADSFIIKPHDLDEMTQLMSVLHEHYFGIIRMPESGMRPAVHRSRSPAPSATRTLRDRAADDYFLN